MIHSVTVTNNLGESLEMILTQPELSGLIVKSIDGMGPADATVNLTELATVDGSLVNSSRLNDKEIKIDLIFLDYPTIEDARLLTYKYFPIKREVTLTFKTIRPTDNVKIVRAFGIVEKNDPKVFSKQEGCSITIKCADPYFHSLEQSNEMFFGTEPLFEFTYSNEIDPNAEKEYSTYDTYDEGGNIIAGMVNYDQVGDPITIGPLSGMGKSESRWMGIHVDRVKLVLSGYFKSRPGKIIEWYNGYVTMVQEDADKRATIISEDETKVVGISPYSRAVVSCDGESLTVRLDTFIDSSFMSTLTITGYKSNDIVTEEVIYYEDLGTDRFIDMDPGEQIVKTYKCSKLAITLLRLYSGSVTIVESDTDDNVIKVPDGTENLELYNDPLRGQIYISRSGETLTLKAIAGRSLVAPLYVNKYNAYYHYKDVYNTEFGNVSSIAEGNIWYDGDSETGLIIDLIFHGNATGIAIYDKETGEAMIFDDTKLRNIAGAIQYGDILRINTNVGHKSVTYIRKDQSFDAMNALLAPLQWFKLTQGENVFGYDAETGLENLVFDIKYDILYGGI